MVLPLDPEARVGTVVAGRYRLERLLGAGGMGEVYVAVQQPLGRHVALKLMRAGLSGPAAQRFEREAKSLAATLHPNIVTLFDYGVTGDGVDAELFMAMELVRGRTLREHLADHGRLTPAEALPILVDICRALDVAHTAGIVHRDLKPENVMVAETGRTTTCKVLDFGIARLNGSGDDDNQRLTKTGHLVGTPGYMAPETVLEGVFDDPRSDLYAVGVIAWELLTNHSLFSAPTPIALVMKHALDPPPTLTATLRLSTPPHPALEQVLATLLHKDRHQRYASAADVIAAIEALPAAARLPIAAASSPFDDVVTDAANIDPSAPTMASTRHALPTPIVARGVAATTATPLPVPPPSAPQSSPSIAPLALPSSTSLPSLPSSSRSPVVPALIAVVVVLAAVIAFVVLKPAPPTIAPPVVAPPVVAPPTIVPPTPPTITAPIEPVVEPSPALTTKPKPTKPAKPSTKPTKPSSPHVPDLD